MNKPAKILYLEDDPRDVELVQDVLEQSKMICELQVARDRAEYEAALAQKRFDLILSDHKLPDYDGLSALDLARQKQPGVPFILTSGTLGEERAVDCMLRGATDYVLKQNLHRLIPSISRALREAQEHHKRLEAEYLLRASEVRYRRLFESAKDGILILDAETGMVENVNPFLTELLGHPRVEFLGRKIWQLGFMKDIFASQADFEKLQQKEYIRYDDLPLITSDGRKIEVEFVSNAYLVDYHKVIQCNIRDATERKRVEAALQQSERNYREIFNAASDAIFIHDADTGAVLDVNDSMLHLYGLSREEALRLPLIDCSMGVTPYSTKEALQWMAKAVTEGPQIFEWHARKKTGGLFWVEVALKSATISGQRRILAVVRDITDRKQAEAEREKLQSQLIQSQKMESVGRLAGGVAHDFNNMLGVILGHAELALTKAAPAQTLHADLVEIHKAALRSAELTRQLLAFARKQTVSPKVLNLNETIASILNMLKRLIGENIDLNWKPKADLWMVNMDPSQIDQILANLCVNARDAINDVGMITIEAGNVVIDDAFCAIYTELLPGQYVRLAVSDNGCGMDKETLSHIFEPFFTTKEMGKGTGLGLAMVYGAVKQNNGFINVYSEPDHGTTFTIYLPKHTGKAEQTEMDDSAKTAMRGNETILLVEDEQAILNMTTMMLESQGYTILAASTPTNAIRLAREHTGEIHLLISDVVMPEMNGRDLAQHLLSIQPQLKQMFMSGYTADAISQQGILDKGVYFIQKPFSIRDLAAKVREALDQK